MVRQSKRCTEDTPGSALGYQDSAKGTWGEGGILGAPAAETLSFIQARTPSPG